MQHAIIDTRAPASEPQAQAVNAEQRRAARAKLFALHAERHRQHLRSLRAARRALEAPAPAPKPEPETSADSAHLPDDEFVFIDRAQASFQRPH